MAASWKHLFFISDMLERAALEFNAESGDDRYAGLSVSQRRAYIAIKKLLDRERDGISLKALSSELRVTSGAASEMVEVLVNKGIVTRTQSKSDRRAICIDFPDELKRRHRLTEQVIQQEYESVLDVLSPEERTQFEALLKKIYTEYSKKGQN